jgi:hypothetical protein
MRIDQEQIKKKVKEFMSPVIKELDTYEVRDNEHAVSIIDYAINLHAKHQKWKAPRIISKTVQYFRLKKKPLDETNQVQGSQPGTGEEPSSVQATASMH